MGGDITISEIARLMQVSVHQVRYFEEQGVLMPAYVADNKYRMYGTDEIYRLAHILLLRKLGLSVQDIRRQLEEQAPRQMDKQLRRAISDIDEEMARLQELKRFMGRVLEEHAAFPAQSAAAEVINCGPLKLKSWVELDGLEDADAKSLAGMAGMIPGLFETDLHYVVDDSGATAVCTRVEEGGDLTLPDGQYLCLHLLAESKTELERQLEDVYAQAAQYGGDHGPLVLIEKSYLSLFSPSKLHYEVRLRLGESDSGGGEQYDGTRAH